MAIPVVTCLVEPKVAELAEMLAEDWSKTPSDDEANVGTSISIFF